MVTPFIELRQTTGPLVPSGWTSPWPSDDPELSKPAQPAAGEQFFAGQLGARTGRSFLDLRPAGAPQTTARRGMRHATQANGRGT